MNDRRTFGWDYPAGAENDPRAPWNQVDPPCDHCGLPPDDCECGPCIGCGELGSHEGGLCEDCRHEADRIDLEREIDRH